MLLAATTIAHTSHTGGIIGVPWFLVALLAWQHPRTSSKGMRWYHHQHQCYWVAIYVCTSTKLLNPFLKWIEFHIDNIYQCNLGWFFQARNLRTHTKLLTKSVSPVLSYIFLLQWLHVEEYQEQVFASTKWLHHCKYSTSHDSQVMKSSYTWKLVKICTGMPCCIH